MAAKSLHMRYEPHVNLDVIVLIPNFYHFNFLFVHKLSLETNNLHFRKAFRSLYSCLVKRLKIDILKILKEPFDDHSFCEILVKLILIQLQKSGIRCQKKIKGRNHQRKFNVITNLRAAEFQGQKIHHLISGSSESLI